MEAKSSAPRREHAAPPPGNPDAPVTQTQLPLRGRRAGKVRDLYELPAAAGELPRILVVATDRISAFDVVLPTAIPGKGKLLTEISMEWFRRIRAWGIVPDHVITTDPASITGISEVDRNMLRGRCMICRKVRIVPVECVVRGWLAGSGFAEYLRNGRVCGVPLPAGLAQWSRLPEPIFTPASKAQSGHDENITFEQAAATVGGAVMERLRSASLAIYRAAAERCAERGLILADTKFEFGFALDAKGEATDELVLADEVLTPDSSRYWIASSLGTTKEPESLDKQFVRNWLLAEEAAGRWNRTPPGPELPHDVVEKTIARYQQAAKMLGA
ncbi:MAG: phosphoribosylaminoimidazolesuccinocarboxamide synthase [Planctomycetes bacterium]|nr:phosphoribosylaminoimidazolesuccinocarboxamide synthase [Planctomycetota bacterium]